MLKKSRNISWLYSNKWRVIVDIALSGGAKKSIEKLGEVRKLAREYMHWETLRECDFYEALYSKNQTLFQKVYFGSPHEHYRSRMHQVLTSNLYRPVSIYEIFHHVFQELYFSPLSSKGRTYKAIASMKKQLNTHPSGVSMTSKKGYGYQFRASSEVQLIYPIELASEADSSASLY